MRPVTGRGLEVVHGRLEAAPCARLGGASDARAATLAPNLRPSVLTKRIEDHNTLHVSAVRHILGVKLPASKRASRGDDGAVPIREAVLRFDI